MEAAPPFLLRPFPLRAEEGERLHTAGRNMRPQGDRGWFQDGGWGIMEAGRTPSQATEPKGGDSHEPRTA